MERCQRHRRDADSWVRRHRRPRNHLIGPGLADAAGDRSHEHGAAAGNRVPYRAQPPPAPASTAVTTTLEPATMTVTANALPPKTVTATATRPRQRSP